ncbi:MAG: hypothetical protein BWK80_27500 [Desulfobacteraceae bacterium IS3]|nr:MAG: hypothetical protein BWK80_27500 [Desulfobacteraceae bacterium IS3]
MSANRTGHPPGEEKRKEFITQTEYPELIYKKYCNFSKIYLIADNAEYFHAEKVSKLTDEHKKLNLVFLPGYAPNLNLIERFRRFAEKKPVKNKYYKEYSTDPRQ